ncbi:MAG: hypothetical protein JXB48_07240, partial [Candidatus Latescibacteria bacterium]|nr:hypothetical protein [Candidatus Latescibacterota bacterium]
MYIKAFITILFFCVLILFIGCSTEKVSDIRITDMRCEYRANPLGIDERQPRLSWIPVSDLRGQTQTAYEIIVASDENKINQNNGDLWSTGKVNSNQTINVVYMGKELDSGQRSFWKVRIWDQDDTVSDWSDMAWWEMALLNPEDWTG